MAYAEIQKRIRRRRIRFRIYIALILISIAVIYLVRTPVLKVKKIILTGNNVISSEKYISLSGINIGDNMLTLNIGKINGNIKTNPYVESSKIRRTLTGNLYINIRERKVAGIVNYDNRYVTMDKKGVIIETLDTNKGIKVPLITGLDIKNAVSGKTVELYDGRKLSTLEILFDNISSHGISDIINEIDLKSLLSIVVKTKYGVNLKLGSIDDIGEKIEYCKAIIEQDVKQKGLKGSIDVSFKGNPVFEQE